MIIICADSIYRSLLMFSVTVCTSFFLGFSARSKRRAKMEDQHYAHVRLFDQGNAIGRPYISRSGGGGKFPRARGRRHFPRVAALLSARGLKSPSPRPHTCSRSHGASRRNLLYSPGVAVELLPAIIHYAYLRLLVADSCWRALSY